GDVVAVVGVRWPAVVTGLEALGARLRGNGEVVDLHAGVVVVELASHVPAVGVERACDAVADHPGAAVADVQRTGRVGRHVFHARRASGAAVVAAEGGALGVHGTEAAQPGGRCQPEVQETGAGDLHRSDVV